MSEFRKAQYSDLEENEQNAQFEDRSFEPKISDEDLDNKVEVSEPEPSVEVLANEPESNVEPSQEIASLSEDAALEQIKSKYGDGDWNKSYDTSGEYRFNKVARVMEQETEAGEIKNITQTIQGEKYISLHQESLQAWSDGEIHLMESEKITDNGVVLEVFAQWVEADGRIRSVSWSREVVAPELPTVEDGSDDEGGDEDESVGSIDEVVPDDIIVAAAESATKAEVVIEMSADWEGDDEDGGGSDEEDSSVSSVQGFGFQTRSEPVENVVAQAASLRSVDTSQARPVKSTNFREVADVLGDATISNELAKGIEVVASEQKDAGELAPESKVDQANSFVENINLFSESAIAIESANVAVNFETTEATTESDDFAEVAVVEETVAEPAPVETGDVVIDMDGLWGEAEARDESYQVGSELNIAEQSNNVVSEQIVAVREYATASQAIVESVKQVESVIVEQAEAVAEQADINSAHEQITSAEPAEVFVQPVEVAAQSTEAVQETGSVIQMFEYQKENRFGLNQDKNVELGSIEQGDGIKTEEIINVTEEVPAVESVEYDVMQEDIAEISTTETATIINLADYWGKGEEKNTDNKLNNVEQVSAVLAKQEIVTSEPLIVREQVQSVAESKPAKVNIEQDRFESDAIEAGNIINMATYWREKNQKEEEDFSASNFEAQQIVLNLPKEQLGTFSNSYVPVADELLTQDGAREIELIQQAA